MDDGVNVGVLHPGAMGISVAAAAAQNCRVFWVSDGRSEATWERAEEHGITDAVSLEEMVNCCHVIISVCPPHAATEVALNVAAENFSGCYVDANAISPMRTKRQQQIIEQAGGVYVDGGIIGGPAWKNGTTRMYLSGPKADLAAECFDRGPLRTPILSKKIGDASALKMTFAAYTKGVTAMLGGILCTAEAHGVLQHLLDEWSISQPGLEQQSIDRVLRTTAKAWRFAGEMEEIRDTFAAGGVPDGMFQAASELYAAQEVFKDWPKRPGIEAFFQAILDHEDDEEMTD